MRIAYRVAVLVFVALMLSVPAYMVYTRFCLPQYRFEGETLVYRGTVYVPDWDAEPVSYDDVGRVNGIGVPPKRTIADLIWPFWVMEYGGDRAHRVIFVRGLMDIGTFYRGG